MGMFKSIWIKFFGDTSHVDAAIAKTENNLQKVEKKTDDTNLRVMQAWSYANQITNLILQNTQSMFEGTKAAAAAQQVVAGLQVVQQEVAIATTVQQALAAQAKGNWIQAGLLWSIVSLLQFGLVRTMFVKEAAAQAKAQVEQYSLSVELWRQSYR